MTATTNAVLALALMLFLEFAISGSFQIPEAYVWAVSVIGLVIFFAQFWRQRRLCRNTSAERQSNQPFIGNGR